MPDTELTDMKLSKKQKSDGMKMPMGVDSDSPNYPYGLRLSLGNDDLKKLPGLKKADMKDAVTIRAVGHIVAMRQNDTQAGKDRTIEIQIEKLSINGEEDTEFTSGFESKKD